LPDLNADRVGSTPSLMRTIVLLHAAIADNTSIADRFPARAATARKRAADARRELRRAQIELADRLLA
jgi:hypothetical protein